MRFNHRATGVRRAVGGTLAAIVLLAPVARADVTINPTQFTIGATAGGNTVVSNWVGSAFAITAPVLVGSGSGNNSVIISNYVITANAASSIGSGGSGNLLTLLTNTTLNTAGNLLSISAAGRTGNGLIINGGVLTAGEIDLGNAASLVVTNGGRAAMTMLYPGWPAGGATVTVTGLGSVLTNSGELWLGLNSSDNSVTVSDYGLMVAKYTVLGGGFGGTYSNNTLTVTGGAVLTNTGNAGGAAMKIGDTGNNIGGKIIVRDGGVIVNLNGSTTIGTGGTGSSNNSMVVTGGGSVYSNNGSILVGALASRNSLSVADSGQVSATGLTVGGGGGAVSNSVTVSTAGKLSVSSGGVVVGAAGGGDYNFVLVNSNGLLQANTLTIIAGTTGNTISNRNATYQFTAAPVITSLMPGDIALTDGTLSFHATSTANVATNYRIAFAGANTFTLNNASNTTAAVSQTYRFDTITGNPSNYVNLVMVNGTTAYGNGAGANITIGAAGSMLMSNTTATISGLVTNTGSLSVVNTYATFQSRVYNSGTSTILNSVAAFNGGAINAGHWLTDPTTNIFGSFGLTNTTSGVIHMAAGDVYVFANTQASTPANFINVSTNHVANNTLAGKFLFSGGLGLTQTFAVAGHDLGPISATATNIVHAFSSVPGMVNNFALGTLEVSNFSTVRVTDAFIDLTLAGLYLENLFLGENSLLIIDEGVQVYFKNSNAWSLANIRLLNNQGGGFGDINNYDNTISGLHQIVVIPEPSVLLLCVAGFATMWLSRRRR